MINQQMAIVVTFPGSKSVPLLSVRKLETRSLRKQPTYFQSLSELNKENYSRNHGEETSMLRTPLSAADTVQYK
jgi:hypothetical protein